ncbi:hypothetical protein Tco_0027215 [Tanacetum coccineum]
MENEHELSYETLTRVYLGSYEHYNGLGAEVEHSKPGIELQGSKMVETGLQDHLGSSRQSLASIMLGGDVLKLHDES